MAGFWRVVRWTLFVVLSIVSWSVLAGVCQSLTDLAMRYLNHELDQKLPLFLSLMPQVIFLSVAAFLVAGRLLSWTLPVGGRAALYTLLTLGSICALVPLGGMPAHSASLQATILQAMILQAMIRCPLAMIACGLMIAGSRLRAPRFS
jgi:hypothetical protein